MRARFFSACALAPALLLLALSFPTPAADDRGGWIELIGKDRDVWKTAPQGWTFAESVAVDPQNPRKLVAKGEGNVLVNAPKGTARDLITRQGFGDVELHMEFLIPKGSNSGVKFHAHYEIQIYDSFGKKDVTGDDCGGIYPRAEFKPRYHHIDKGIAPKVNACKAPGEWQTLDVVFLAPRFDKDGKKTANAKIVKAVLNGRVIHADQELATPTGHNWKNKEVPSGPLLFQGDHGPVAFRNVRVRPLDGGKK